MLKLAHCMCPHRSYACFITCRRVYKSDIPHKGSQYNAVLPGGGSFFNTRWLDVYTHVMPSKVRQYVDDKMNCDDTAFNMLVASTLHLPPVFTVGSLHTTNTVEEDGSFLGLRYRGGHMSTRGDCIKFMNAVCVRMRVACIDLWSAVMWLLPQPPATSPHMHTRLPIWFQVRHTSCCVTGDGVSVYV